MSFTDKKILRKPELDAFIAQAFSPELMNAHYLQELQVHFMSFWFFISGYWSDCIR
jgi:hypothetical protein